MSQDVVSMLSTCDADPALRRVVESWPTLDEPIRRAVLAVIDSSALMPTARGGLWRFDGNGARVNLWPTARSAEVIRKTLVILSAGPVAAMIFDPTADPGDLIDTSQLIETGWTLCGRLVDAACITTSCSLQSAERQDRTRWRYRESHRFTTLYRGFAHRKRCIHSAALRQFASDRAVYTAPRSAQVRFGTAKVPAGGAGEYYVSPSLSRSENGSTRGQGPARSNMYPRSDQLRHRAT